MDNVYFTTADAQQALDDSVVTIGNFDGMHIGHQAIFDEAVAESHRRDITSVALTFEPHPSAFFRPDEAPVRLSPPPYKFELMRGYGVDVVVALTFDETLANMSPEQFVEQILVESLSARHVVVGKDFRFGKKRAGDTDSLCELGAPLGMTRKVAEFVEWDDQTVSSTRIRKVIEEGDLKAGQSMLGRPYRLYGEVVSGEERGRKLGFPTANMDVVDMALPPNGVYMTTLGRSKKEHWQAITNIGRRPTFEGRDITVETFVLDEGVDENLDLYGDDVELDIYGRIRDEREFDSPRELIAQIKKDIAQTKDFFDQEDIDGR